MKKKSLLYGSIAFVVYILLVYILYLIESSYEDTNIQTFGSAFWYSIVTLTTVGYGDYYPVSTFGRIFSLVFILGSLGILGFLISQLNYKIQVYMESKKYGLSGIKIKEHTLIFGLNKFSTQVISEIISVKKHVVVVSNSKKDLDVVIEKYQGSKYLHPFYNEYDNYAELNKVHIEKSNCVYVSFVDDSDSLVHILNLQSSFKDLNIIVNLNKPFLKDTFANAGVLFSISQEEIASKLIASYIFEPNAASLIEDIMSSADLDGSLDLQEYRIVEGNPILGESYDDSFYILKKKYNSVLVGIYKESRKELLKNPQEKVMVEVNDRLVFIADTTYEDQIEKDFIVEQGV